MPALWPIVERVLARYLPARQRTSTLGDLKEDYDKQRALDGRWLAELWLLREALSLVVAYRGVRHRALVVRPPRADLHAVARDLRHAFRSLRRAPWYVATVSSVLALAMAMTVSIFAMVDGVLFAPVPYAGTDRVFAVNAGWSKLSYQRLPMESVSPDQLDVWRAALPEAKFTTFFSGDAAIGPSESAPNLYVDAEFFEVVGVRPWTGGFTPEHFATPTVPLPAIAPAILAHRFWVSRFGADPATVGRTFVDERGRGIRVVGILPANFVVPDVQASAREADWAIQVISPFVLPKPLDKSIATSRMLKTLVRLPPGMTVQEATTRLTDASSRLAAATPASPTTLAETDELRILRGVPDMVRLTSVRDALTFTVRQMSQVVFWATIALALLACLNVTSLAVARVHDRWRDLAVHRALGADRRHLVRLLVSENLVIVAIGTGAGLALAPPLVTAIVQWLPASMSLIKPPAVDLRVILFAMLTATFSVAAITVGAAHAASRANLRNVLAAGGRATSHQRRLIVGAQIALALVLTVGGALVTGSLLRISNVDVGLREEGTAVVRLVMPGATSSAIEQLLSDVRIQPGVLEAGGIDGSLLQRARSGSVFDRPPGVVQGAESIAVTTGFFAAAGLRAARGRLPTDEEVARGEPVLVVSERVAAEYWPDGTALGQSLSTAGRTFTVVGIVRDVRYMMLDSAPTGAIYWPLAANSKAVLDNIVISLDPVTGSLGPVAEWMRGRCPTCRISRIESLTDAMNWSIRHRLVPAWLFSSFGIGALVIVGVGLLGLVAMTTARRTREMGVRIALGATPIRIARQVAGEQTAAVAAGLIAGGLIAAWAARFVKAYLYEISVYDLWAWCAAIGVLLAVALIAAVIPAVRAGWLDPVKALRTE